MDGQKTIMEIRKTVLLTKTQFEAMAKIAAMEGLSVPVWLRKLGLQQVNSCKPAAFVPGDRVY